MAKLWLIGAEARSFQPFLSFLTVISKIGQERLLFHARGNLSSSIEKNLRFKVVITDSSYPSNEPERRVLAGLAELNILQPPQRKTEEGLIEALRDADGILNESITITRRIIESLEKCRIIVRYGVGYDNVDVDAATERGILVCNVPDYCIDEVADHTMALILALNRKLLQLDGAVKAGAWDWKLFQPIRPLKDAVLGILGFGRIGAAVAERARSFGLKIVASDPYVSDEKLRSQKVEPLSLAALLEASDIVSLHVPLTKETYHMLGEGELRRMKKTAYIVNTSRGALIDSRALYKALSEGWIAGAALDVWEVEPPRKEEPLLRLPNVIATPHIAWYSEESLKRLQVRAAEEVARVLRGEKPRSPVNLRAIEERKGK